MYETNKRDYTLGEWLDIWLEEIAPTKRKPNTISIYRDARRRLLTHHPEAAGNAVMVDVSEKPVTAREATAHGIITMNADAFAAVESGTVKKGDVLGVARVAGIMATKRTSELIPLCHPLPLTKVQIEFDLLPERRAVEARCTVKTSGVTGVEMEALTGVSTALLTIYDMCKAVDKGMELGEIHLVEKTGGKSGHYIRAEGGYV